MPAGCRETAMQAACVNWLLEPTTNVSKVKRGLNCGKPPTARPRDHLGRRLRLRGGLGSGFPHDYENLIVNPGYLPQQVNKKRVVVFENPVTNKFVGRGNAQHAA